jgi:hypothetical protein
MDTQADADEKTQDPSSLTHSTDESEPVSNQNATVSAPSRVLQLPEDLRPRRGTLYRVDTAVTGAETADQSIGGGTARKSTNPTQPVEARTHWDVSDVWGTQSYGQSKKACAMCAQHVD